MRAMGGAAIRLAVVLLGMSAGAADRVSVVGVWARGAAEGDLGQCSNVESMRIQTAPGGLRLLELVSDESGRHLIMRDLTISRWAGRTIQVEEVREPRLPPLMERWTLSRNGAELSIQRRCGKSVQRLAFQRSTASQ